MFSRFQSSNSAPEASFLTEKGRTAALAYLGRDPQLNLQLLDITASLGRPRAAHELEPLIVVAREGEELVGVAALRPSLIFDAHLEPASLEAFLPFLAPVESGLIKSHEEVVTPLWEILGKRGRRSLIDRIEIAFALRAGDRQTSIELPPGARLRRAEASDLADLVYAARASLQEEGRPDPFETDPIGFERWVRGRLARARIVEVASQVAFVGYVDVQRPEGWLVQGVFTWSDWRRHGLAAAGMAGIADEAFEAGADHLQLAVVEGNEPALALYRRLGFRPFARLRTVLFA